MSALATMESAPRDGTMFLVRNLSYGTLKPCMRRVKFDINDAGEAIAVDCGSWLFIYGITQLEEDSVSIPTIAEPDWGIAPDELNDISVWRWMPIPEAKDFAS